jgi:hypothetical protein
VANDNRVVALSGALDASDDDERLGSGGGVHCVIPIQSTPWFASCRVDNWWLSEIDR